MELLSEHFKKYFLKEAYDNFDWILNPFVFAKTNLSGREEEELSELSSDRTLIISFNQKALASFWLGVVDIALTKDNKDFIAICHHLHL